MTSQPARLDDGPLRCQRLLEHDRPRSLCLMVHLGSPAGTGNAHPLGAWTEQMSR